jgi:enoyl-CoA hydratase
MTKSTDIQFTDLGGLGVAILNRPQALNALTHRMALMLYEQLDEWANEPDIKTILIQGAGEKIFCAGGDIREIYAARRNKNLTSKQFFWDEYRLNHRIHHYSKPYIALIDGVIMGGGVGIAMHGSHRIATEHFKFAMPETSIGFFPDIGGSYCLARCPGQTGIYLGLTGARIQAADALYLGLVDYFVPEEKKAELIDALASSQFTGEYPHTIATNIIKNYSAITAPAPLEEYRELIDQCFAFNTVEEIVLALQQHPDNEWCAKTLQTLLKVSPTSLKITLQQLRNAAQLDFDECLKMDYRLALRFLINHDFYEGIRAAIIDKDQKPQWQPAELNAVTQSDVDKYFAPLKDIAELSFT